MKNIILGAAVSAAMVSGAAQAVLPTDGNGLPVLDGTVQKVYLSGASAARKFIEELLTNSSVPGPEALCDSTKPIYKYKDSVNGKKQNAYLCDINTSHSLLGSVSATHVMLYKRSEGGSAQGVSPLLAPVAADRMIEYLKTDNSNCTLLTAPVAGVTLGEIECTYSLTNSAFHVKAESDFGVSDVDPGQFIQENTPAGFSPADDISVLSVQPTAALAFGIPVTKDLRDALQEAQIASGMITDPSCTAGDETEPCMPSLSRHQVASFMTGKINNWNDVKVDGTGQGLFDFASTAPGSNRVHICRRVPGSGTQAQMGIKFLNRPCSESGTKPAVGNTGLPEAFPITQVHEMSGSGDVTDCLNELNDGNNAANDFNNTYGKRWAIGIQSLEKNADLSDSFRFVKIDGVAPTLENVANGKYLDWVELTFQTTSWNLLAGDTKFLVDGIMLSSGSPTVLGALDNSFDHDFGKSGYLAVPTAYPVLPNAVLDPVAPINPYSHATKTAQVDNCRVPAIYEDEMQLDQVIYP